MLGNNISNIITIPSLIFAFSAAVLAFIFIIPEKKREKLNSIGKLAHDICNFKFLIVEKILQFFYVFATATAIFTGFFMLFYAPKNGFNYYTGDFTRKWMGGTGLLVMFLGPIAIHIFYEFLMMIILLVKNVIQINNKMKAPEGMEQADIFGVPTVEIPKKPTCPKCGANVEGAFCPVCGTKVQ